MSKTNFNGRIILKHDIQANWDKAINFIPFKGEIIVYDIDENYNYERMKIGDGVTNVNELPFADDALKTELLEEINEALLNNQSDWAQNDETAADYIKNRTHYEDEPLTISWDTENAGITVDDALYLVETDEAKLETIKNCTWAKYGWNNGEVDFVLNRYDYDNYIMFSTSKREEIISSWGVQALLILKDNVTIQYNHQNQDTYPTKGLYLQWDTGYNEFVSPFVCDTIHKLDSKFIPWPDENDALELIAEMGIVEPVAASDGSIYTNNNGVIYTL